MEIERDERRRPINAVAATSDAVKWLGVVDQGEVGDWELNADVDE